MRLKFNDIGIIKEADILLEGLTVLSGVNDTGKSTIGKLLYSLIKVSNNYKSVLKLSLNDEIKKITSRFRDIALDYYRSKEQGNISDKLRTELSRVNKEADIFERLVEAAQESSSFSYKTMIALVNQFADKVGLDLNGFEFKNNIDEMKKIFEHDENSLQVRKAAFDMMIREEFKEQISSINSQIVPAIFLEENGNVLVDIGLLHNETIRISTIKSSIASDITYIESPLQLRENGERDKTGNGKSRIYLKNHVDDLMDKLSESDSGTENIIQEIERKDKVRKFEKIITEIIGGDFSYKAGKRNFIYSKNGNEIRLTNTATGIRVFAMIKLLLNSGNLKKNSILIIDEPEVHLHPQWQMDYAELIVRMVKELGIKVLINSHSPYMIEAFKVYSDHHEISKSTNFYNMVRSGDFTEVKLANDHLDEIFSELSDPFSKLDNIEVEDFVK